MLLSALKYSRQRESIKEFLANRYDHPTADMIYANMRALYPNISLGTVYRNLSLLVDMGEVLKLSVGDGPDRFDGNTEPHYHFICTECQNVLDLKMESIDHINVIAGQNFDGEIKGHMTYFYGVCGDCIKKS